MGNYNNPETPHTASPPTRSIQIEQKILTDEQTRTNQGHKRIMRERERELTGFRASRVVPEGLDLRTSH